MIAVRALWRWMRRRPDIPVGYRGFAPPPGALAMPLAFTVAALVELVVLHLLIPWEWLRWTLAILTIVSLIPLLGSVAAQRVYPHLLGEGTFLVRSGGRMAATIPVADIAAALPRRRYSPTEAMVADGALILPTGDGTNVEIDLSRPVDARLHAPLPSMRGAGPVTTVRLNLERPADLITALASRPGDAVQR